MPLKKITKRPSTLRRRDSNRPFFENIATLGEEDVQTVGVCLSGGGPRSAMFCSGVLESILASGVQIDYLSSVSGGGYVASSYMDWKYRNGGKDDPSWHKEYFQNMTVRMPLAVAGLEESTERGVTDLLYRAFGLFWWLGVVTFAALFSTVFTIVTLYARVVGQHLREAYADQAESTYGSTLVRSVLVLALCNLLKSIWQGGVHTSTGHCQSVGASRHVLNTAVTVIAFNTSLLCMTAIVHEFRNLGDLAYRVCLESDIRDGGECQLVWMAVLLGPLLAAGIVISVFFVHGNTHQHVVAFYMVLLAASVEWEVFIGEEHKWHALRWLMAIFALLHPIIITYHQNFLFMAYKGALRETFYHPDGRFFTSLKERFVSFAESFVRHRRMEGHMVHRFTDTPAANPKTNEELVIGDLRGMKPEWICQLTLNRWRYDSHDPRDSGYKILTISSELVDIIDYRADDTSKYLDLTPESVRLSTAMTMSAGALAAYMGSHETHIVSDLRELLILFGIRVDNHVPTWFKEDSSTVNDALYTVKGLLSAYAMPSVIFFLHVLPMWCPSFELRPPVLNGVAVAIAYSFFLLSLYPSDSFRHSRGVMRAIGSTARYLITNCVLTLLVREMVTDVTVGKYPDFVLHISDGGHTENLGLLALLRRRANKIVVSDASAYDDADRSIHLATVFKYARLWLGCRFQTVDYKDVDEDVLRNFGGMTEGKSPQTYMFRVEYTEVNVDGEVVVFGEGEIFVAQPRHPKDFVPGDWSGPKEDYWTPEYADSLNGALSRNLHNKLPSGLASIHGVYPAYDALHLALTPQMCEALRADGKRAMESSSAKDFLRTLLTSDGSESDMFKECS